MADLNDLQKTLAAPQKTATPPQKTAAIQKTAAMQRTAAALVAEGGTPAQGDPKQYEPGASVQVGKHSLTVKKVIGSGAEGTLYLVTDGKREYALKLCNPGFKTNMAVMPAVTGLPKGYTVEVVDYAENYELMAYYPEGSVAQAGFKGDARWILAIVLNTAMALDKLHRAGVLHKDVKPANILIKNPETMATVLCDFGIADQLGADGKCATRQLRTPIYAAPEVYTDTVTINDETYIELTPKADFYSLGMTILSLWMGEGAFRAEQNLAIDKVKGRVAVPEDMPDPLARICRGLLIKNPVKRWGLKEIEMTLDGKDVPVEEDAIIADLNITYNATKRQIANTPEELAQFMAGDLDLAMRYLYRGDMERWLQPYPELAIEMQDIVEKRLPKDRETGVMAAIYFLSPAMPFHLSGLSRETGEPAVKDAVTLKDVADFCNDAIPDEDSARAICSKIFREWVRVRNKDLARKLPEVTYSESATFMLRVQTIDPLSDINLRNDPSREDYAMTQEGIGQLLNDIYTLYWNNYEGDFDQLVAHYNDPDNAPLNREIPLSVVVNIIANFGSPEDYHYVTDFYDTKGQRFKDQRSWFVYCTDRNSDDYIKKAGPKDDIFRQQAAWMKVIVGYGLQPVYALKSGEGVYDTRELFSHRKKELREEYENRGLRGWLAVQHQENPDADLSAEFAYETLLQDYLEDLRRLDDKLEPVKRFDEAREEADRILSEGKGRVRGLAARSVLHYVGTLLLAVLPAVVLLAMLVFSIIENPIVDTSGLKLSNFIWTIGLLLSGVVFFTSDTEDVGCMASLMAGGILAAIIWVIVKFLGGFILYLFAAIVLAVLIYFSIKTLFSPSPYAREARKFTKPGFDEQVLEPLYYAFSDDDSFDSSLNGAFDDDQIANWKDDLKRRRFYVLVFMGVVWVLFAFSLFIPKSERFGRLSKPLFQKGEKVVPVEAPKLLEVESLEPGTRSEDVKTMQQFLKEGGYFVGTPSPTYGPATKKAVKAFQKANGLEESGVADAPTIDKINQLAAEASKAREKEIQ